MAMSNAEWARTIASIKAGRGGTSPISLAMLQRYAKTQANLHGPSGSGQKSTLEEIGGAFKNAGSIALNTLSVPQAMLFTAGSKAIDALSGGKMKSTMGWDEMLGGFSPNYRGYKEIIQQVGEPMGLSKDSALGTWGGLAGDLALDPLWFVGPAKLAKGGGEGVKALSAITKNADAGRFAPGVSKDAGTTAMLGKIAMTPTEKAIDLNRTSRAISNDAGTMAMLKKFAKTTPYPPVAPPSTMGNAADALKSVKVTLRVEGGGAGISNAAQELGVTRGTQIGNFFIHEVAPRSRKKGGPPAKIKIYRLAQPNRLHSEDVVLSPTFTTNRSAEEWLRARINEVGGDFNKVEPRITNLGPNGAPNLHDVGPTMAAHRVSAAEQFNGQKNVLGLKFGVGKPNPKGGVGLNGANYTIRTKVPVRSAPALGAIGGTDKVSGFFKRSAFAKAVNQKSRAAREMQAAARQEQSVTARAMSGLSDDQAKLVTFAAGLDNVSRPGVEGEILLGSEAFVPQLKASGSWTPEMDKALKYAQGRMGAYREMHGISEKTYRKLSPAAMKFQQSVQNFVTDSLKTGMASNVVDRKMTKMVRDAVKAGTISKAEAGQILGTKVFVDGSGRARRGASANRGPYLKQMLDKESAVAKAAENGLFGSGGTKMAATGGRDIARKHESLLNYYTKDEWSAELQRLGIEPSQANELAKQMGAELSRLEKELYPAKKEGRVAFSTEEIASRPETDLFRILGDSDAKAIHRELMSSVDTLATDAGLATRNSKGKLVFTSKAHERVYNDAVKSLKVGEVSGNRGWQKYMKFVSYTKMVITSMQPQHYFGNATGDYAKVLVQGNHRHWVPPTAMLQLTGTLGGRATKGSRFAKLVSNDIETMNAPFAKIGGHEYSGAEVLWMTHMVGLGKGFAGAEIAELSRIFEKSEGLFGIRHLKQFAKWSTRHNQVREDAVRIQTWLKHVESGDDIMTAGLKTIRAHFDYNNMTDFEKTFMRQFILFYTWSRMNIPFQTKAMAEKPGLYSGYGDIERDRPKMPGEPDYISKMGLIGLPLLGSVNVAAPWADLNKIPSTLGGARESIRNNVLGALAPGFKQGVELAADRNMLTGGPAIPSRGTAFGFDAPGLVSYFAKQYNPYNTQAGRVAKVTSDPLDIIGLLGNMSGTVRRVQPDPKWTEQKKKAGG